MAGSSWSYILLPPLNGFPTLSDTSYSFNMTFNMTSKGMHFLYYIWSGVLQGDPMSATLFLMCLNPFLVHFDETLTRSSGDVIRACADDLGASLNNYPY